MIFYYFYNMKYFWCVLLFFGLYCCIPTVQTTLSSRWIPTGTSFDSLAFQISQTPAGKLYEPILKQMYFLCEQRPDLPILQWRTKYWGARYRVFHAELEEAQHLLEEAAQQINPDKYPYDRARIIGLQSQIYLMRGDFLESYKGYRQVSAFYSRINDTLMLANTCVNTGVIMQNLEDWNRALDFFEQADSCFNILGTPHFRQKNRLNLSNALYRLGEEERAVKILEELLAAPECCADTSFKINVLLSLFSYTHRQDQAEAAYQLAKAYGNKKLTAKSATGLAAGYLQAGREEQSLPLYRKALAYINENRDHEFILPVLQGMTNTFAALKNIDSAYYYLCHFEAARDSLSVANGLAEIRHMDSRAAIEHYEYRLSHLREKSLWQSRLMFLLFFTVACIAAFVCYIFWTHRHKERILKQLREAENKELCIRLEHETLYKEQLRREVDSRNRELAERVLAINTRNRMLNELKQQLDKERQTGNIPQAVTTRLKQYIMNQHVPDEEEGTFFHVHFEGIYPGFFSRLQEAHPDLSEHEMRFCAYVRMGMDNKMIARILFVQPDSIKKLRHRIRKKVSLPPDDSLENYLRTI